MGHGPSVDKSRTRPMHAITSARANWQSDHGQRRGQTPQFVTHVGGQLKTLRHCFGIQPPTRFVKQASTSEHEAQVTNQRPAPPSPGLVREGCPGRPTPGGLKCLPVQVSHASKTFPQTLGVVQLGGHFAGPFALRNFRSQPSAHAVYPSRPRVSMQHCLQSEQVGFDWHCQPHIEQAH